MFQSVEAERLSCELHIDRSNAEHAYLTDTDTYQGTFKTVGGDDLGFHVTGKEYEEEVIVPGGTVPLNLTVSVDQPNDLFIFADLNIPADFSLAGLNSTEWHPIGADIPAREPLLDGHRSFS